MTARVVVIGGGISGLSAAWALVTARPDLDVTVIEGASHVGGKIRRGWLSRVELPVDVGAESVLARRPEALDLMADVGLDDEVVHPRTASASLVNRGALRPLPTGTLMGIPADPARLAPVLTDDELRRASHERVGEASAEDVSIGDLVAERLGDAVVDRVVEPLLGGVYAGHARRISAAAALPAAFAAHRDGVGLTEAARRALPGDRGPGQEQPPVFAGLSSGLYRLPARLVAELGRRGVRVRTGVTVRALERTASGFRLVCGSAADPQTLTAEGVVVAVPPAPAARLLADLAPVAGRVLGEVQTASMAIVTLAVPLSSGFGWPGSGVLVPPVEGLSIKAATFSSQKWDWVRERGTHAAPGPVALLRTSLGRQGEEAVLQRDDADLVDLVVSDLRAIGLALPDPADSLVQRWGGGLPQYAVGHRDRVAAVRAAVADVPGLAVAGATYDGVGIPACIASGRAAAEQVAASQWAA
ncbi:MAG TPA: protoporphyrinogen oxidase [Ornithinimicrobium sp.]|uniref:protoporphyrinogen oxidase n=1 Tax=Ornithinimicrobium sp. TaxID=1977084 RepID=UPI002B4847C9|nr:protoporphyrinogen oxidase [Ornithinimicrobium sp.]HKJ12269.1 protoporphyrinogen oxidase [Ornithinimicrobium sp.]